MANIVILGGLGTIGKKITPVLSKNHQITILDRAANDKNGKKVDAANYNELYQSIPDETDIIINLIAIQSKADLLNAEQIDELIDAYLKATINMYQCAVKKRVKKVIFASTNHVTDFYEEKGKSTLGRRITINDYPFSKNYYGILKLASENIGHAFHQKYDIQVINLRIGSVRENENKEIFKNLERFSKTILTEVDLIQIFEKAIETNIPYGTYYAVSDNGGKPWDTKNLEEELGFQSLKNTADILREVESMKEEQ